MSLFVIKQGTAEEQANGTWWGTKPVLIKCPNCGKIANISRASGHHHIVTNGEVQPSLDCPNEECTFHEFVRLEGWEE